MTGAPGVEKSDSAPAPVWSGAFRVIYLATKSLGVYAGVYLLCFFWPRFASAVLLGVEQPHGALLGAALLPLGLLVLGATSGAWAALAHGLITIGALLAAYWTASNLPGEDLNEKAAPLLGAWTWINVVAYTVGYVFGLKRQLSIHAPDPEAGVSMT